MKISKPLAVLLLTTVVSADSPTSKSELGNTHHVAQHSPSAMITQTEPADSIRAMVEDSFTHTHSSDRWLGPLVGLKTFTQDIGARATVRAPRLNARNEGALGQAPWYGMAFGLACTTLAALMLG
ncbi:hypothetical protein TMatcc_002616 [Talaromyces marneffei ATCC 18224]|uniref:uncharacterized protein n=1 Tax=Talaromyces marneffei TaxID=37727 RepID=UPI0012A8027B|nr:uncharacterized protein EYB26_002278 [Talaromyces marneffei]KAE8555381.1 hypothetical protein EYB25_000076 [Talaromyces marneffei]QGA14622.1 hypothetical protein EYB26_002278 [Talaromyces marneffei]